MLSLYSAKYEELSGMPGFTMHPSKVFARDWDESWFESDFARRVIKDIDGVDIGTGGVNGLWFNGLKPDDIAGGSKTLLLLANTDRWTSITRMGENCFKFLQELASTRPRMRMGVTNYMFFSESDMQLCPVYFERSVELARTREQFYWAMVREVSEFC